MRRAYEYHRIRAWCAQMVTFGRNNNLLGACIRIWRRYVDLLLLDKPMMIEPPFQDAQHEGKRYPLETAEQTKHSFQYDDSGPRRTPAVSPDSKEGADNYLSRSIQIETDRRLHQQEQTKRGKEAEQQQHKREEREHAAIEQLHALEEKYEAQRRELEASHQAALEEAQKKLEHTQEEYQSHFEEAALEEAAHARIADVEKREYAAMCEKESHAAAQRSHHYKRCIHALENRLMVAHVFRAWQGVSARAEMVCVTLHEARVAMEGCMDRVRVVMKMDGEKADERGSVFSEDGSDFEKTAAASASAASGSCCFCCWFCCCCFWFCCCCCCFWFFGGVC